MPLLSTALLELWQDREGQRMTPRGVRATGGVQGAVARLAERAYATLSRDEQRVARRHPAAARRRGGAVTRSCAARCRSRS